MTPEDFFELIQRSKLKGSPPYHIVEYTEAIPMEDVETDELVIKNCISFVLREIKINMN